MFLKLMLEIVEVLSNVLVLIYMKCEIEIPIQTRVTLQKPCHLNRKSKDPICLPGGSYIYIYIYIYAWKIFASHIGDIGSDILLVIS